MIILVCASNKRSINIDIVQFATCTKYQFKYTGKTWVRECSTLYRFVFKITLGQKIRAQYVSMLDFCARDLKVFNRVLFFFFNVTPYMKM